MNEALNSPYFYRSWIRHDLQSYKTGKHKHPLSARIRQLLTQESWFFSIIMLTATLEVRRRSLGYFLGEIACERESVECDPHDLSSSQLEVTVSGTEVTLTGTVSIREQRRRAEDIAESISGVKHVQKSAREAAGSVLERCGYRLRPESW